MDFILKDKEHTSEIERANLESKCMWHKGFDFDDWEIDF